MKAWILVLVINGVTTNLSQPMIAADCQAAWKKYVKENPKMKYNTFCEWRNP
jgi:hypothetical protein